MADGGGGAREVRGLRAEVDALRARLEAAEATDDDDNENSAPRPRAKKRGSANSERAADAMCALVCAVYAVALEASGAKRSRMAHTAVWAVYMLWPKVGDLHDTFELHREEKTPHYAFCRSCPMCEHRFGEDQNKPRERFMHATTGCRHRVPFLLQPRPAVVPFQAVPHTVPSALPSVIANPRPAAECMAARALLEKATLLLGRADVLTAFVMRWVVRSRRYWVSVKLGVHLKAMRALRARKGGAGPAGVGGMRVPFAEFVGRPPLMILLTDALGLSVEDAKAVLDALAIAGPGYSVALRGRMHLVTSKADEDRAELMAPFLSLAGMMPEIAADSEVGELVNLELRFGGVGGGRDPLSVEETLHRSPTFSQDFVLHADLIVRDHPETRMAPGVVGHSMHSFTPAADRIFCRTPSPAAPAITAADRRWRFQLGRHMEEAQAGQASAATAPGTAALAVHATLPPPSPSAPPSASASRKRMRPG